MAVQQRKSRRSFAHELLRVEERQAGDRHCRIACPARSCGGVDSIKSSSCRSDVQPLLFFFRPHRLAGAGRTARRRPRPPKRTKLADREHKLPARRHRHLSARSSD